MNSTDTLSRHIIKPKDCPALLNLWHGKYSIYQCPVCGVISGSLLHPPAKGIMKPNVLTKENKDEQ